MNPAIVCADCGARSAPAERGACCGADVLAHAGRRVKRVLVQHVNKARKRSVPCADCALVQPETCSRHRMLADADAMRWLAEHRDVLAEDRERDREARRNPEPCEHVAHLSDGASVWYVLDVHDVTGAFALADVRDTDADGIADGASELARHGVSVPADGATAAEWRTRVGRTVLRGRCRCGQRIDDARLPHGCAFTSYEGGSAFGGLRWPGMDGVRRLVTERASVDRRRERDKARKAPVRTSVEHKFDVVAAAMARARETVTAGQPVIDYRDL